jgi:DNA-binding NtrC family response regulator
MNPRSSTRDTGESFSSPARNFETQMPTSVLVVDDDPMMRMRVADLVQMAGMQAIEAADAEEAVEILDDREDIDIVLSDIDMPGRMNGLKLASVVRDRWPDVDILLMTGHVIVPVEELPIGSVVVSKPLDEGFVVRQLHKFAH